MLDLHWHSITQRLMNLLVSQPRSGPDLNYRLPFPIMDYDILRFSQPGYQLLPQSIEVGGRFQPDQGLLIVTENTDLQSIDAQHFDHAAASGDCDKRMRFASIR